MYFAGAFDFSTEGVTLNRNALLKFPVRVPLERVTNVKKRQRESDGLASASSTTELTTSSSVTTENAAIMNQLKSTQVTAVATGAKHTVCVINGALYGMGCNASGQLGGSMPPQLNILRELAPTSTNMTMSSPIIKLACGRKHTIALTASGEVYTTGDNTYEQLGHSNRKRDWAVVRSLGTNNIIAVSAGSDTSYALGADGSVFSWGRGESLALGHPITRIEALHPTTLLPIFLNIDTPLRIEGFATKRVKILEISAGTEHVVARDDKDVFTFGQNSFGKLGTGNVEDHLTPYRVAFPERKTVERVLQVAAVGRATIVLKHNPDFGTITYIFGKEGGNQDGTLLPRVVFDAPLSIARIVGAGPQTQVAAAVTDDGKLYTWGHSTVVPMMLRLNDKNRSAAHECTLFSDKIIVKDAAMANGQLMVVIADVEATLAAAADPSSGLLPDGLAKDIVVPYKMRLGENANPNIKGKDNHDEMVEAFYKQLLGEADGSTYVAAMEKPLPYDPNSDKPQYHKQGVGSLHVGSKVRLWMSDVYALGTITDCNPLNLQAPLVVGGGATDVVTAASSTRAGGAAGALSQHSPSPHTPLLGGGSSATLEDAIGGAEGVEAVTHRNHHYEVTWVRDDWDPEIVEFYSDDETLNEENENRWQKGWYLEAPVSNGP